MSRAVGYICLSHEPNLASEYWFNQSDDLLTTVFILERAGKWPNKPLKAWEKAGDEEPVEVNYENSDNGTNSPIYWLRQHPNCKIGIQDEYHEVSTIPQLWGPDAIMNSYISQIDRLATLVNMIKSYTNTN